MPDNNSAVEQSNGEERDFFTPFTEGMRDMSDPQEILLYIKKLKLLPGQLQLFLRSFNTATWIETSLASEFVLSREQKRAVARIIRQVSTGEVPLSEMDAVLNQKYGVDSQTAKNVAQKIQFQLLTPVIDEIKTVQRHVGQDTEAVSTPKPRPAEGLYENMTPPPARSSPPVPQAPGLPPEGFRVPDIGQGNVIDLRNQ